MKPVKHFNIPVRLDEAQLAKLDAIAAKQFNSRSGMIRMGIDMLIRSIPPEPEQATQPEAHTREPVAA
jgi:hypothetical protein